MFFSVLQNFYKLIILACAKKSKSLLTVHSIIIYTYTKLCKMTIACALANSSALVWTKTKDFRQLLEISKACLLNILFHFKCIWQTHLSTSSVSFLSFQGDPIICPYLETNNQTQIVFGELYFTIISLIELASGLGLAILGDINPCSLVQWMIFYL